MNFHGNDPTTWLDIYDPLQATEESALVLRRRSSPTRRRRAGRSSASSTCGGPTTTAAPRPTSRRTATRCTSTRAAAVRRLGADGPQPDRTASATTAAGSTSSRRARAERRRHAVGGDADRPAVRHEQRRRARSRATSTSARLDTPSTPGRFVSGIAVDPSRPEPRLDLVLGLRRVHARDAAARARGRGSTRRPGRRRSRTCSYDLGDQPVTGIAEYGPTGDLYAATDFGVLRLPERREPVGARRHGPADRRGLRAHALSQSAHVLYAATHGRGAYTLSLPTS